MAGIPYRWFVVSEVARRRPWPVCPLRVSQRKMAPRGSGRRLLRPQLGNPFHGQDKAMVGGHPSPPPNPSLSPPRQSDVAPGGGCGLAELRGHLLMLLTWASRRMRRKGPGLWPCETRMPPKATPPSHRGGLGLADCIGFLLLFHRGTQGSCPAVG